MLRRAWPLLLLVFSDCRCRQHAPIVIDEPAAQPIADLSLGAADLATGAIGRSPQPPDLAGVRTSPPTENEVRAAIRPVLDPIARCIQRSLPSVDAQPVLRFKLDPAGKLSDVRVEGITGADSCVQQALNAVLTPSFAGEPAETAIPLGRDGRPIAVSADAGQ
jgi:hypothetical protein